MPQSAPERITEILQAIERGESQSSDALLPVVYEELRRLARSRMARERPGQTLQPTALVHEAYLRLLGGDDSWQNRGHFFAAAAEAMRRILIEKARSKARNKRGGDYRRTTLEDLAGADGIDPTELLDLDRALDALTRQDSQMAGIVKLRYFAGFSIAETAEILDISERSVNRSWTAARTWLATEVAMGREDREPSPSESSD
ncbi:MAG: sigma-70 family RNA polymerase sigma factor [Thermoanaerobaculia bacterium]|nr:sigma-70 family RNA polymerase sigma factor [Thermoanaerobaculia bacterium]